MSQPLVCAIMLTADRPEMTKRAALSFSRQSYPAKELYILDTSASAPDKLSSDDVHHVYCPMDRGRSIGWIRNLANAASPGRCQVLVHWDSDDVSHPNRIAEQVQFLQSRGADCVGYSDLVFWKEPSGGLIFDESNAFLPGNHWPMDVHRREHPGATWLYTSTTSAQAPGTSLCFWRKTWERKPFPDQPRPGKLDGEDYDWVRGLKLLTRTSLCHPDTVSIGPGSEHYLDRAPRIIASIHGGNTSGAYAKITESSSWRRMPEMDTYCRERMAL